MKRFWTIWQPGAAPRWAYVTGAGVARTCEASEVVRGMFVTGQ